MRFLITAIAFAASVSAGPLCCFDLARSGGSQEFVAFEEQAGLIHLVPGPAGTRFCLEDHAGPTELFLDNRAPCGLDVQNRFRCDNSGLADPFWSIDRTDDLPVLSYKGTTSFGACEDRGPGLQLYVPGQVLPPPCPTRVQLKVRFLDGAC